VCPLLEPLILADCKRGTWSACWSERDVSGALSLTLHLNGGEQVSYDPSHVFGSHRFGGRIAFDRIDPGSMLLSLGSFTCGNFTARAELAMMDEDDGDASLILCDRNDTRLFVLGEDHEGNVQLHRVDEHGNMVPWTPKATA
jgi:hypothetical protein